MGNGMNTCYELLQNGADRDGRIVFYGHAIKTSDFLQHVERLAGGLKQMGLNKGDVVTLQLPTCPQALAAFYACSKLGVVTNVVHPLVPVNLLAENLAKTRSKALFFFDATVRDERPLLGLGQTLVRCSIADYVTVRKPFYKLYSALGKRLIGVCSKWAKASALR